MVRTTLALRRILKQIEPDILHMHSLDALIAPILLRFKPFLVSVWGADIVGERGLAADSWRVKTLKQIVLRNADAVIALSRFLAEATSRYSGLPPERIMTHYWGVDLKQFGHRRAASKNAESDSVRLGFVKHLLPKYGPEYFLRAVARIRKSHMHVKALVIGDGPLRAELESLASALGVADNVTFLGAVPHDQVPRYLSEIDIFVMPSVYESETFGVAAAEAQAMGIPVVATRVGGISEAVVDGVTGLLVPPRDEAALAQAILRLMEDRELRKAMSIAGPEFVTKNFDWQKNARSVEDLYSVLLEQKRQGIL